MSKNPLIKFALYYLKEGYSIIPVKKDKKPLIPWKEYQERRASENEVLDWFHKYNVEGIAVVTGKISNLIILDTEKGANLSLISVPKTPLVKTGGGGYHFWFKYPQDQVLKNYTKFLPLMDIRGEGGYAIIPPSLHLSGEMYEWETTLEDAELAEMPQSIINQLTSIKPLKRPKKQSNSNISIDEGVGEGQRNEAAAQYAGTLLANIHATQWEEKAWPQLQEWNGKNKPPLDKQELRSVFDSIAFREKNKDQDFSQSEKLIKVLDGANIEYFHDQFDEPYARIKEDNVTLTLACNKESFKMWLRKFFWQKVKKNLNTEKLKNILELCASKALHEGKKYNLENRVAELDNAFWYYLGGEKESAIKIQPDYWEVIEDSPILFRNYSHQQNQLLGNDECDIFIIFNFIKLKHESDKILFLVCLISSLIPGISHAMIILFGQQGASKTTAFKVLKKMIDPSRVDVLSVPRDINHLIQQLDHHYAAFYDNIDYVSATVSDILCRAITGEGGSNRKLYTNDEDHFYSYRRVVGLNGINVIPERPDLLDRSILFELDRIIPTERKPEKILWKEFDEVRPNLFRTIIGIVAKSMKIHPQLNFKAYPRMADFMSWGFAITESLGLEGKEFENAYNMKINGQHYDVIENSNEAICLIEFMRKIPAKKWMGTIAQLNKDLWPVVLSLELTSAWPKKLNNLSKRLNKVATDLKGIGLTVEHKREKGNRIVIITKTSDEFTNLDFSQIDSDICTIPMSSNINMDDKDDNQSTSSEPSQKKLSL